MKDPAADTVDVTDPPPRGEVARRRLVLVLRIAVSTGMLWFLLTKISECGAEALPEWTTSTALWLTGAVALTLASILLSAVRWQTVLAARMSRLGSTAKR